MGEYLHYPLLGDGVYLPKLDFLNILFPSAIMEREHTNNTINIDAPGIAPEIFTVTLTQEEMGESPN